LSEVRLSKAFAGSLSKKFTSDQYQGREVGLDVPTHFFGEVHTSAWTARLLVCLLAVPFSTVGHSALLSKQAVRV
jgi:hypothetical protein